MPVSSREVNNMIWLAFSMGVFIGLFLWTLVLGICVAAKTDMPDIGDVEP